MSDARDVHDTAAPHDPMLESYLSHLEKQLGALSLDERREILMETRSHVSERTARFPFPTIEEVLAQFGRPDIYARQFLQDKVPRAIARRRTALQGLARLAAGGWLAMPVLLLVLFAYTIALAAFATGLTKIISPGDVGVWVHDVGGRSQLFHAGFNSSLGGREILGYWLAVIAFGIAFTIFIAVSAFLRWLARTNPGVTESD
jgi:uncharacterized membrane protein